MSLIGSFSTHFSIFVYAYFTVILYSLSTLIFFANVIFTSVKFLDPIKIYLKKVGIMLV